MAGSGFEYLKVYSVRDGVDVEAIDTVEVVVRALPTSSRMKKV